MACKLQAQIRVQRLWAYHLKIQLQDTIPVLIHTELIPKESKSVAVILINFGNLGNCNCNF